jgi:hypothetical protein
MSEMRGFGAKWIGHLFTGQFENANDTRWYRAFSSVVATQQGGEAGQQTE